MNSQNRFALPLAAVLVLTLSTAFGADEHVSQPADSNPPATGAAPSTVNTQQSLQKTARPEKSQPKTSADVRSAKDTAPDSASAQKVQAAKSVGAAPTQPGSGTFTQSALNSVDAMVRADDPPPAAPASTSNGVLSARVRTDLAKKVPVKAGTIDEQVHEDGRREERVHTLYGGEYCVTFESPSDPKDGIDKMQWGIHPGGVTGGGVMPLHSCGHRFD